MFRNSSVLTKPGKCVQMLHSPNAWWMEYTVDILSSFSSKMQNVKLSWYLIMYVALGHESIWGNGRMAPPFITLALDGGELSASCPCCFTPGDRASFSPLDRRLSGCQSWSGCYGEEKNLLLLLVIKPRSSSL
jgi:hypothetical protein